MDTAHQKWELHNLHSDQQCSNRGHSQWIVSLVYQNGKEIHILIYHQPPVLGIIIIHSIMIVRKVEGQMGIVPTFPSISGSPKTCPVKTPTQMRMAVICPNEPRICLGEISLKYIGRALRAMPVKMDGEKKATF